MPGSARLLLVSAGCVALLVGARVESPAHADLFELEGGGRLEGVRLNSDEQPARYYELRTRQGILLTLERRQVKNTTPVASNEHEYARMAADGAHSVPRHWALAQWCREHNLQAQRQFHLRRILELEPNHQGAHLGLGHSQVRGRWVTQEESMLEKGYVRYRGKWLLQQQVELLEVVRKREVSERHWHKQLLRWRRDLTNERAQQATESFLAIQDPDAIRGIASMYQSEASRGVKLLLMRAVANIKTPRAIDLLINIALMEADEELLHYCYDHLARLNCPQVQRRLTETLRHEDNGFVNHAARALGRIGDKSAVNSLIDALCTVHLVPRRRYPLDEQNFESILVPCQFSNQAVLTALVELTGTAGYSFDQKAWKQWRYLQVQQADAERAKTAQLRRGK